MHSTKYLANHRRSSTKGLESIRTSKKLSDSDLQKKKSTQVMEKSTERKEVYEMKKVQGYGAMCSTGMWKEVQEKGK